MASILERFWLLWRIAFVMDWVMLVLIWQASLNRFKKEYPELSKPSFFSLTPDFAISFIQYLCASAFPIFNIIMAGVCIYKARDIIDDIVKEVATNMRKAQKQEKEDKI